jgi:hypothetical protein
MEFGYSFFCLWLILFMVDFDFISLKIVTQILMNEVKIIFILDFFLGNNVLLFDKDFDRFRKYN